MGSGLAYWPSISGDTISVLDREGYLQSVDLLGKKLSREPIDIGGTPVAAPTTLAGLTCVVTANGSLKLYNSRIGKNLWSYLIPPTVARKSDLANDGISAAGAPIQVGNSLVVLARDGSLLCFDKSLGVDMTAPEVKLLFPNPGEAVSGRPPLPLFFKVTDDGVGYDPATVTITIDGVKIAHERTREGYYFMAVSEHGPLLPLKDGRRSIVVTATDYLGNTAKEEFSLVIDNQLPPITLPGSTAPAGPVPGGNPGGGGGGSGAGGGGRGRGGGG
jgi:hypothetical protein